MTFEDNKKNWFLFDKEQKLGPFSEREVYELIAHKKVPHDTYAINDEMKEKKKISDIEAFYDAINSKNMNFVSSSDIKSDLNSQTDSEKDIEASFVKPAGKIYRNENVAGMRSTKSEDSKDKNIEKEKNINEKSSNNSEDKIVKLKENDWIFCCKGKKKGPFTEEEVDKILSKKGLDKTAYASTVDGKRVKFPPDFEGKVELTGEIKPPSMFSIKDLEKLKDLKNWKKVLVGAFFLDPSNWKIFLTLKFLIPLMIIILISIALYHIALTPGTKEIIWENGIELDKTIYGLFSKTSIQKAEKSSVERKIKESQDFKSKSSGDKDKNGSIKSAESELESEKKENIKVIKSFKTILTSDLKSAVFNKNGDIVLLLTGDKSKIIRIKDFKELLELNADFLKKSEYFSPKSQFILLPYLTALRVFSIGENRIIKKIEHNGNIYQVLWSKSGELFATLSKEKIFHSSGVSFLYHVKVFDFKSKKIVAETNLDRNIFFGAFSNNNKFFQIEAESWDKKRVSKIINLKTNKIFFSLKHDFDTGPGKFSPNGDFYFVKSDKNLIVVDMKKRKVVSKIKLVSNLDNFDFAENKNYFHISSQKGTTIFNITSRKIAMKIKDHERALIVNFLQNSNSLVLAFPRGIIKYFDISSKKLVRELKVEGKINFIDLNSNEMRIGINTINYTNEKSQQKYIVFDLTNGKRILTFHLKTDENFARIEENGNFLLTSNFTNVEREIYPNFNLKRLYNIKGKKFDFVETNKEKQNFIYLSTKKSLLISVFGREVEIQTISIGL